MYACEVGAGYVIDRTADVRDVEWHSANEDWRWREVQVTPLIEATGVVIGASIAFSDVSAAKKLQPELEHANQELETEVGPRRWPTGDGRRA